MTRNACRAVGAAFLLAWVALAAQAQTAPTAIVTWNKAALQEVRLGKQGPPIAARALAIAHTCMYDAWAPYDARAIAAVATSIARRPGAESNDANKAKAVSFAAYRCLLNLYPAAAARLDLAMRALGYDPLDQSTDLNTPQGIGNAAAAAVIASRRHDGSNQYGDLASGAYADYTGYAPVNAPMPFCLPAATDTCVTNATDPTRWQPLTSDSGVVQRFIAPHWERVKPFALSAASQFDSRPEAALGPRFLLSSAALQADMDEILSVASTLDATKKLIVEYWADGPDSELPPGHWGLFAQAVSARDRNGIDKDVKMFFAMHNASFDAGIVAWHLKRKWDGVRPITAVRRLLGGRQTFAWGGPGLPLQWIDAGTWTPYNPGSNLTPSFPGWVSGHATFSAASAAVLRSFTGSDHFGFSTVIPANFGRVEPGVPAVPTTIGYATFTAAANEAAASRLLAGIHFSDDNSVGLVLGDLAGKQAWAKAQYLFDGGLGLSSSSYRAAETQVLSWTHTVDALSNRLLVVGLSTTDDDSYAIKVSYGDVQLKRLGSQNGPFNDNRVELWYMVAPPVGSATLKIQLSNNNDIVAGAMNFTGVNQTAPFGILRTAANSTTSACVTLANEAAPLVVTMLAVNSDAGIVQPSAGQSHRWNAVSDTTGPTGAYDIIGTGMVGPGAPVATVCNQLQYGKRWATVAVPLKPAQ